MPCLVENCRSADTEFRGLMEPTKGLCRIFIYFPDLILAGMPASTSQGDEDGISCARHGIWAILRGLARFAAIQSAKLCPDFAIFRPGHFTMSYLLTIQL